MSTIPADQQKIWFAQALRPFACFLVIAFHYMVVFVAAPAGVGQFGNFPPITDLPKPAYLDWAHYFDQTLHFGMGLFSVDLLFLVSGFVIPFSLKSNSLKGFFVRRFFRLYPTLWIGLTSTYLAASLNSYIYGIPNRITKFKTLFTNALLLHPYYVEHYIDPCCWTLLVEEMFYIVCAILAWRGRLRSPSAILLVATAMASFSLGIAAIRTELPYSRRSVVCTTLAMNCTHAILIFVGVALHHLYVKTWRLRVGLPVIAVLMGLYGLCCHRGMFSTSSASPGEFYAGVNALIVFGIAMMSNRWLPYSRWVDRLANVSYPLYLIHGVFGYIIIHKMYLATGKLFLSMGVALVVVLAVAILIHRWVEKPTMEFGRRLTRNKREFVQEVPDHSGSPHRPTPIRRAA